MKGLIHIYCGHGKGKTTAAMGLALRAAGTGRKVIICQFLKGRATGELETIKLIPNIEVYRLEKDFGFYNTFTEEIKAEVAREHTEMLQIALDKVETGECDMLILDEVISTYGYGLIDLEVFRSLITNKKSELELVLTGRDPDEFLIEHADYVSRIEKVKHPFDQGIPAREGIEM